MRVVVKEVVRKEDRFAQEEAGWTGICPLQFKRPIVGVCITGFYILMD